MSDEHDPTDDTEEPAAIGEVVARLLADLFRDPAAGEPDKPAVDLPEKLDEAFELLRDAVSSGLGELGSGLEQLSSKLADAASDASDQVAALADAVGGASSIEDAVERVMGQLGATTTDDGGDDEAPKSWDDLGIALDELEPPPGDATY